MSDELEGTDIVVRPKGFQKGRPKTGGRKKEVPISEVIRGKVVAFSDDALVVLYEMMMNPETKDSVRFAIGQYILSISVAKAARKIEVEVNNSLSDLHKKVTESYNKVIDITPEVMEGDEED